MKNSCFRGFFATLLVFVFSTATADSPPEGRISADKALEAAEELGDLLRDNYVFPEIGRQYKDALNARIQQGFGADHIDLDDLAADLERVVNKTHFDAHLAVNLTASERAGQPRMRRVPARGGAIGTTAWIDDDIAYLELLELPGDQASQDAMADFLDEYRGARALILDARMCPGGTLPVIDVLSSRLYAEPTHLVTMETRIDASGEFEAGFEEQSTLKRAESGKTVARFEHWSEPSADPADRAWSTVPVYLLTGMTASACEHLALALKTTDRATLVGDTTAGAGHFGGERVFADGALQVFLPVGRTYDPATGKDWEGVGVAPHIEVPAGQALQAALTELDVDPRLASNISRQAAQMAGPAVRRANPDKKSYGLGIMPPRPGASEIQVAMVRPDSVAEAGGVQEGDRIVAINSMRIADMDEESLVKALRSPTLDLAIERAGESVNIKLALE